MKNCCNQGLAVVNEPFFCPRMQAYVVRGPRGATGAQGPQGPQGLNGTISNHATFATVEEVGILANGALPIISKTTHHGTKIIQLSNLSELKLSAGTYFISYDISVLFGEDVSKASFAIAVNREPIKNLVRSVQGPANSTLSVNGSGIITLDKESTLSIQNISAKPVEISNFVLSIFNLM